MLSWCLMPFGALLIFYNFGVGALDITPYLGSEFKIWAA